MTQNEREQRIRELRRELAELEEARPEEDLFNRYLSTYAGRELIKKHALSTVGLWEVKGEDTNCDFSGSQHLPKLGYFNGILHSVITEAVKLPKFWCWGQGGEITLIDDIKEV